jgi:hypothetical protein
MTNFLYLPKRKTYVNVPTIAWVQETTVKDYSTGQDVPAMKVYWANDDEPMTVKDGDIAVLVEALNGRESR